MPNTPEVDETDLPTKSRPLMQNPKRRGRERPNRVRELIRIVSGRDGREEGRLFVSRDGGEGLRRHD
jgi:hypothetical protein